MTKRIICAGQKGGIGKSTIARALAVGLMIHHKKAKVILVDTDFKQRTGYEWAAARQLNNLKPVVRVEVADVEAQGFHVPDSDAADYIIFDCPGWSDEQTLTAAQLADLIVLPTGPAHDDLRPLVRLLHEMHQEGIDLKRIAVALFRMHTPAEDRATREYVEKANVNVVPVEGHIPDAPAFSKGQNAGQCALEVGGDKQRQAAASLISALISCIDDADERSDDHDIDWSALNWSAA